MTFHEINDEIAIRTAELDYVEAELDALLEAGSFRSVFDADNVADWAVLRDRQKALNETLRDLETRRANLVELAL